MEFICGEDADLAVDCMPAARHVQRTDAVRNQQRVLSVAADLFASRGVANVTMEDIAAAAGVGKGTLYRGFGDKGGLAVALLSDKQREFQQHLLSGAQPLGAGLGPGQRLEKFVEEYLGFVIQNLALLEIAEMNTPGARFHSGAYWLCVRYCEMLLTAGNVPHPQLRAEMLMASLTAEQVRSWTDPKRSDAEDFVLAMKLVALDLMTSRS